MRNAQTFLRMKTPPLRLGMCPLPMETPPLRVGMCSLPMETPPLRLGACLLRMETPLRGRSGGHTGAAPTISRVAPCPKVAGRGSADGLKQKMIAGIGSADGQNRKWLPEEALPTDKIEKDCRKRLRRRTKTKKVAGRGSADGLKQEKVGGRGSADGLKQEMVAGRGSADGLKQEKVAGRGSADGQKRKTHPEMCISGVGFRLNMLRKWLSWRLDCEILHFFIIFAAEKIKPI